MNDTPSLYQQLLATAVRAAHIGAEVLLEHFRHSELEVRAKDTHEVVTRADHESEAKIIAEILADFPEHHIVAEESGRRQRGAGSGHSELEWLIDPLDGTSNFSQGLPIFCVSIACRRAGEVVAAVVLDPVGGSLFTATAGGGAFWNDRPMRVSERRGLAGSFLATGYPFRARGALDLYLDVFRDVYLQVRSIRRCGSAALDLAYTAAGVYDGFFELRLSPWDFAAGVLLVREAGGTVTSLDGDRDVFVGGNLVAGPGRLQAELLEVVRTHLDEQRLDAVDPVRNKFLGKAVE